MNTTQHALRILLVLVLMAGPVMAEEAATAASAVATVEQFNNDWAGFQTDNAELKKAIEKARQKEDDLRADIEAATKAGKKGKVDQLTKQLAKLHAENIKKFESKIDRKKAVKEEKAAEKAVEKAAEKVEAAKEPVTKVLAPQDRGIVRDRHEDRRNKLRSLANGQKKAE